MRNRGGRSRSRAVRAATVIAVAVLVGAMAAMVATGVLPGRGWLTGGVAPDSGASSTPSPSPTPTPTPEPVELDPVLEPAEITADQIARKRLATRINRVDSEAVASARVSVQVTDPATGQPLYRQQARTPLVPASTTKVLTSAAALQLLGPEHRFSTRVVTGGGPQLVLVGGGDPYLAKKKDTDDAYPRPPSLQELAAQTATALRQRDQKAIRLGYDASLFTGPAWNPTWTDNYRDYAAPTSALWADGARKDGAVGPRQQQPDRAAAEAFAGQLRDRGITVRKVARVQAGDDAEELAAVESLPLRVIIEQLLMTSDNDATEVIARQVAIADGRRGSIKAATAAIEDTLTELDAWTPKTRIRDGSGLSRQNRISADMLTRVIGLATSGEHPELAPLLSGLPVAGVEGSLSYRFASEGTGAGHGRVRAKTGTLSEVTSLAGYVRTADGRFLSYAAIVNGSDNPYAATVWLDRISAAIARCGCS